MFRIFRITEFVGVTLACSALGCGESPGVAAEGVAWTSSAIIGGAESSPTRDYVLFLHIEHSGGAWSECAGTLISPRVLVTAKHCIAPVGEGAFVCDGNGEVVQDGSGAGLFGQSVAPQNVQVYLGAVPGLEPVALGSKLFTTQSMQACRDDLALLVLDRAVDAPSYPAVRASTETRVGEEVRLVGYGTGQRGGTLARREIGNVRVLDVGPADGTSDPRATTPPRSFAVPGNTACVGDSGGPALSMANDALIGVYSRISGDCLAAESRNTFVSVNGFVDLLETAQAEVDERFLDESADASDEGPASDTDARYDAVSCAMNPAYSAAQGWGVLMVLALCAGVHRIRRARAAGACAAAPWNSGPGA
jgi:hypothetical protein